jgi:hypothetical protein
MKALESIQSTTGQLAIEAPDISGVPFVDFDNRLLSVVGGAIAVRGMYGALKHTRNTNDRLGSNEYTAGSDVAEIAQNSIKRGGRRGLATGLLATGLLAGGVIDFAGPHIDETTNEIDSITVVVETGYEGYPRDVQTDDGETTSRIEATVNSIKQLELNGIEVSFIAAGVDPEFMGTIDDGRGGNIVVDNFTEYTSDLSQKGSQSNGGGDIESALSIADSLNPDKIMIFAGTLDGNEQSKVFEGEELEGADRVSVIAVGQAGSTVESLGENVPAPIEPAFNEKIVGPTDSYSAESTSELKSVVQGIIDDQVYSTERNDVEIFQKIRNVSAAGLGIVSFGIYELQSRRKNRSMRKTK